LNRVDAFGWLALGARDIAALESPVRDPAESPRAVAHRFDGAGELGIGGPVIIRADVEVGQLAIEEAS
jgi:hypothetical protein